MTNMQEEKLKTKKHLVAYIDFLGSKDLIKKDRNDEFLNQINQIYASVTDKFGANNSDNIKIKIFSDNIIIASEPDLSNSDSIHKTIINYFSFISFFQLLAFGRGFLLRGGITLDDFFIDENFVWGKALLTAIKIEEESAIYPRILIDKKALSLINKLEYPFGKNEKFAIRKDNDKQTFLDYFFIADFCLKPQNLPFLDMFKLRLDEKIRENETNEHVMKKIIWQKKYYNGYCKKNKLEKYMVK